MPVFCEDCTEMRLPSENAPPWRAYCLRHPNEGGHGFVSKTLWASESPYLRCADMNPKGTCPLFRQKATEPKGEDNGT